MAPVDETQTKEERLKTWWAEYEFDERDHVKGCPTNDDRLEFHTVVATTGPHKGKEIAVIRCADCGGQTEEVIE